MKVPFLLIGAALTLGSCATTGFKPSGISEIPMYGNVQFDEQQKAANEEYVRGVLASGLTREQGAADAVKRGYTALNGGDYSTAVKRFNQGWLLNPESPDVYAAFGFWYVKQKDYARAESLYFWYVKQKDYARAEPLYLLALQKDPKHKIVLHDLGMSDYLLGLDLKYTKPSQSKEWFRKAIETLQKCIAFYPDWGRPYRTLSSAYMQTGDFANAVASAEKAQALKEKLEPGYLDYLKSQRDRL